MRTHWFAAALAALIFSTASLPAMADVSGVVRGTVTVDGAAAAAVAVTIAGEGTSSATQTDARGRFTFSPVAFGHYTVTAGAAGKPQAQATVDVSTGSIADVTLAIGTTREIGRTVATTTGGVAGNPVSVTTFSSADLAMLPQQNSLNRLIESVPGIVQFSYDEPVAHGFHGITYEVDGAPVPSTTSANFSQLIDPRNIDSMEVYTGSFPAEFGGQRQGAVVNILTKRDVDIPNGSQTELTLGGGTYDTLQAGASQASRFGKTDVFLKFNAQSTSRGLDSPTENPINDNASQSDVFLRTITRFDAQDTLAFDYSYQFNTYRIPINPTLTPVDQIVNVPGQDDVQLEYGSFGNLNFTHTSVDGSAYVQVIPWFRSDRVVYAGDLANDVLAMDYSPDDCSPGPAPCSLAGLAQDRSASAYGLRTVYFHAAGPHAFKAGIDGSAENFTSTETIVQAGANPFFDNVAQHGQAYAAYAEDKYTPSARFSLQAGLRYDYSNGFVQGNQLQPRIGANLLVAPDTTFHVYYGRLYAAPSLEDTRRDAVVIGGGAPDMLPVYDLKPQTESYYEGGIGRTFGGGISGYVDAWQRNVWNVLDTTQIFPTPIFAVYNNSLGLAHGFEMRVAGRGASYYWFLSGTYSQSVAGGISGGTFLFPPDVVSDTSLQPEDHDQTVAIKDAYSKHFGADRQFFATLGSEYGTGYPVQFQNGTGRLTPHLTFDASIGRAAAPKRLGFTLNVLNLGDYHYLIKVNNGFNTTQWSPGVQANVQIDAMF
jgi:outer membrane receptor protein involved in Fe transport